MTKLELRSSQTQVKHEILSRYLDAWGGIIINGLCHIKQQYTWKFVYVVEIPVKSHTHSGLIRTVKREKKLAKNILH